MQRVKNSGRQHKELNFKNSTFYVRYARECFRAKKREFSGCASWISICTLVKENFHPHHLPIGIRNQKNTQMCTPRWNGLDVLWAIFYFPLFQWISVGGIFSHCKKSVKVKENFWINSWKLHSLCKELSEVRNWVNIWHFH